MMQHARTRVDAAALRGRRTLGLAGLTVVAVALAACSSGTGAGGASDSGTASTASSSTLVIDSTFDLKTADPARSYEFTGELLAHNVYEHATTYAGNDLTKAVPQLTNFAWSNGDKTLTLTVNGTHRFADGTSVTAADIAFSYQRLQGIQGSPSFLLDGVTVKEVNPTTVTLTTQTPNLALPAILANPSLGIVEKKLVLAHGGSTTPQDGAEKFLNTQSAGSAAYQIESLSITSQIVLKRNPYYAGPKPKWDKIVIQNVQPATQKLNVETGQAQIALDISPQEAKSLNGGGTKVISGISGFTVYSFFGADQAHGKAAADPNFVAAVRHAINYQDLLAIAGSGSVQVGGLVPVQFAGSLKSDSADTYNPALAKQLLAKSSYKGEPITYLYASDITVQGLQLQLVAQAIQADLAKVGIKLTLEPQPSATYYSTLRSDTAQAALAYWGPDFPDASNYLAFTPGQGVAVRANWAPASATGKLVEPFVTAAENASTATRDQAYQALQTEMNKVGPIIPLLQPAQSVVTTTAVSDVVPSPLWLLDLDSIQ